MAGLIKEKHFDLTWQKKTFPLHQKGEDHEACPITKSMWPEMERRVKAGQGYRVGEVQGKDVRYELNEHERQK